jgi:hypothetical protein
VRDDAQLQLLLPPLGTFICPLLSLLSFLLVIRLPLPQSRALTPCCAMIAPLGIGILGLAISNKTSVVLAQPGSQDSPQLDPSSAIVVPQSIGGGIAMLTVIVFVAAARTTIPPVIS